MECIISDALIILFCIEKIMLGRTCQMQSGTIFLPGIVFFLFVRYT